MIRGRITGALLGITAGQSHDGEEGRTFVSIKPPEGTGQDLIDHIPGDRLSTQPWRFELPANLSQADVAQYFGKVVTVDFKAVYAVRTWKGNDNKPREFTNLRATLHKIELATATDTKAQPQQAPRRPQARTEDEPIRPFGQAG